MISNTLDKALTLEQRRRNAETLEQHQRELRSARTRAEMDEALARCKAEIRQNMFDVSERREMLRLGMN